MAKCLGAPAPAQGAVQAAATEEKTFAHLDEVRDLEHELKKITLQKQIEIERNKPVAPTVQAAKTPEQVLEEEMDKALKGTTTLYDIERRLKARANEEFADDPHAIQQKLGLINNEIAKRLP